MRLIAGSLPADLGDPMRIATTIIETGLVEKFIVRLDQ